VRRVVYITPYQVSTMLNGCQKNYLQKIYLWSHADKYMINIFADFLIICKQIGVRKSLHRLYLEYNENFKQINQVM
jgi:hypothetical protein